MNRRTLKTISAAMLIVAGCAFARALEVTHLLPLYRPPAQPPIVKPQAAPAPDLHPNPWQQAPRFEHPEMRFIVIYIDGTPRCVLLHDYDWKRVNGKLVWDGMPWAHYCFGTRVEWIKGSA